MVLMICVALSDHKWLLNFKKCAWEDWVSYLSQVGGKVLFANLGLLQCNLGPGFGMHCQRNTRPSPWTLPSHPLSGLVIEMHRAPSLSAPGHCAPSSASICPGGSPQEHAWSGKGRRREGSITLRHKLTFHNLFVRKYSARKENHLLE